jgi:hypothetical protein
MVIKSQTSYQQKKNAKSHKMHTSTYRLALEMASERPFFADVARASVLATRKKSESPAASLADAILAACSSAGIT